MPVTRSTARQAGDVETVVPDECRVRIVELRHNSASPELSRSRAVIDVSRPRHIRRDCPQSLLDAIGVNDCIEVLFPRDGHSGVAPRQRCGAGEQQGSRSCSDGSHMMNMRRRANVRNGSKADIAFRCCR